MIAMTIKVDLESEDTVVAILPSGSPWPVYPRELGYFNKKIKDYRDQFSLSNVSDLGELDRVIQYETLAHRYATWAGDGKDYWGNDVNDAKMMDINKQLSGEVRLIKAALGIDKVTRDKTTGDDSVASRFAEVARKCKEFGVMRNAQFDKALELVAQLDANLTLHRNSSPEEQKLMQCRKDDIWDWIENSLLPDYRQIDADFRKNSQRQWIETINR